MGDFMANVNINFRMEEDLVWEPYKFVTISKLKHTHFCGCFFIF